MSARGERRCMHSTHTSRGGPNSGSKGAQSLTHGLHEVQEGAGSVDKGLPGEGVDTIIIWHPVKRERLPS